MGFPELLFQVCFLLSPAFLPPLVAKTTNLISQTCMNTGFKLLYLLIYKGKVFIGSFSCRNDCMAVHFNCRKRRNAGVLPLELKLHYLSGGDFSRFQVSYDPCIVLICLLAAAWFGNNF